MTKTGNPSAPPLDRAAVLLSGLCVLHCLALPVLIVAAPLVAELAATHWHAPMLVVVVPLSIVAIVIGYRRHGNKTVPWLGALALALLMVGGTIVHYRYGVTADRVLTISGSLLLAWVHWRNSRLTRRAGRCSSPAFAES